MPKVSVIIPTYNRAHIVTDAIDSVLAQSFKDIEVIVVDDGSTDGTKEILEKKYQNKIRYISAQHIGMPQRNRGIAEAKGEYLAFLDSDDLWLPEKLKLQMEIFEKSPQLGLVYCGYYAENKQGQRQIIEAKHRGNIFKDMLFGNVVTGSTSAAVVKRECIDKVGGFDDSLRRAEDPDLWIRITRHYPADFVPLSLVVVRRVDHNHLMDDVDRLDNMFAIYDKVFEAPDCPEEIKKLRNKAYANRSLDYMGLYFRKNQIGKVWECFFKALFYYPSSIKTRHLKFFLKAPFKFIFSR